MSDYQHTRLLAYTEIDGKPYDISRLEARFAINEIPTANLVLGIGLDQNLVPSSAEVTLLGSSKRRPAKVWLQAVGQFPFIDQALPKNPLAIFDGFTTGIGYRPGVGQVDMVVGLEHWLAEMTNGTMWSESSSPTNPADLAFTAVFPGGQTGVDGLDIDNLQFKPEALASDFWGLYIRPWLLQIAKQKPVEENLPGTLKEAANVPVLNALKRFESDGSEGGLKYKYGVRFRLDRGEKDEIDAQSDLQQISFNILRELAVNSRRSVGNITYWDKLLEFGGNYGFVVAPMADRALVVPLVPVVNSAWKNGFDASTFDLSDVNFSTPRQLRGVAVYGSTTFNNFAESNDEDLMPRQQFGIGGAYIPRSQGPVAFVHAPTWMANLINSIGTEISTGANSKPRACAVYPGTGRGSSKENAKLSRAKGASSLMNRYAEYVYANEVLKYRQMTISSKLRFDIGPGSIVAVEVPSSVYTKVPGASDEFQSALERFTNRRRLFYGCVTEVTFWVDAVNVKAGASFRISHVRTEQENQDDGLILSTHPIWTTGGKPWVGCPLIDGLGG